MRDIRAIKATVYRLEDGTVVEDSPIVFQRLWRLGQELVINYQQYIVTAVSIEGDKELVTMVSADASQ